MLSHGDLLHAALSCALSAQVFQQSCGVLSTLELTREGMLSAHFASRQGSEFSHSGIAGDRRQTRSLLECAEPLQVVFWAATEEEVGLGRGCDRAANAAAVCEGIQRHSGAGACQDPGAGDHLPHRLAVHFAGLEECRCSCHRML